jgi:hypothetical protein
LNELLGPEIAWLADPDSLGLPQRFVDGQKFKTLTDLGSQVTRSGNPDTARYIYGYALDAVNNQKALTSPTDFRRLQSIESGIAGAATRGPSGQATLDGGIHLVSTDDKQTGWSLPSGDRKVVLRIDPELIDQSKAAPQRVEILRAPERLIAD